MYLFKKFWRSIVALTVILIIAGIGFVKQAAAPALASVTASKRVILDPGHGGFDGGAGAEDGTLEKDINLEISLKVRDILRLAGFDVLMTHTVDTGTEDNTDESISARKKSDLKNRLALMRDSGDSIYVSIHLNKFTTSAARGAQVFYTPNFESARILGECIQSAVVKNLQPDNHRTVKRGYDSTYLLKNATVPAVIVECGFLSNKADLENLKNESYQKKMAICISLGILDYYKKTAVGE